MKVPSTIDITQTPPKKKLEVPEIRVWCHPHKIGQEGDDYFLTFYDFRSAVAFIKKHPEAEENPLIAFRGYELNLWEMKP